MVVILTTLEMIRMLPRTADRELCGIKKVFEIKKWQLISTTHYKTSDEKITFPSNTELGHTTRLSPRQVTARVFINETRNIIRKGNSGLGSTTRFLPRQVLERSISKAAKDDDDEVGVLG